MKKIYAAFCGVGKSYLCNKYADVYKEIECWEYRKGNFPTNYVEEVFKQIDTCDFLFIGTDPVILKELKDKFEIVLIYPNESLKEEYMQRYCDRNSPYDFIGVVYKHWNDWLKELKEQDYCKHVIVEKGQHLEDIL